MQLFAARARAARPNFQLTPDAASLAADIARQVDGLPLAIELAAARVNVLGLAELHSIVERRLALLEDGIGPEPSRNALHGLVEWSYDLLHGDEKTLLHQLAVHRGGASLPSLLAVAATHGLDEAMVTYLLQALVDKSIVLVSFPEGEARYDLLDTVRDYALAQLERSGGGLPAARKAHTEYFATLAESARTGLREPAWQGWMKQLEREHDNLWAALSYARNASDGLVAARLAVGLGWYFGTAERVSEGREFTEAAVAHADDAPLPLRIELLANLCYLATEEEDLEAAVDVGERAVGLAAQTEAPWETALARLALAFAYDRAGPVERAVALADEARRGFEDLGDRWGAGSSALTGSRGRAHPGRHPDSNGVGRRSGSPARGLRRRRRSGSAARGMAGGAAGRCACSGGCVLPSARGLRAGRLRRSRLIRFDRARLHRFRKRRRRRGRSALPPGPGGRRRGVGVLAGGTCESTARTGSRGGRRHRKRRDPVPGCP